MNERVYHNPRLIVLSVMLIIVGGIAGFTTRASREDPAPRVRWGYVTTELPGAEPLEVESLVSEPIERVLREVGTIRSIESASLRGVSLVFVRLTDDARDVTQSWSKVQDKLTEVVNQLPSRASRPVFIDEQRWGSHTRIFALHARGETEVPAGVLARWAKELDNRLSFVPGTRFTETFGIPVEEILVEIDEETIASTRLTIDEIGGRIRARNSEGLDALSQSQGHTIPVSLGGDVNDLRQLREVVLRGDSQDRQLQLSDVATIRRGERQPLAEASYVLGRRAAVIATRMDDAFEIESWTQRQQRMLESFQAELPTELGLAVLFDQKKYTDARASHLYESLGMGVALVILLVCLMMGWRAAIPICAALPLSLCVVFVLMIPFGISMHQMSIAGLILALGILIDNPIIMVDDIHRRLDEGIPKSLAWRQSVRRLWSPLLGSNVTTILGFAPILLIGGPTGEFMSQMGWSVIASLASSLLLSLTIIPILAAWLLKPTRGEPAGPRRQPMSTGRGLYLRILRTATSFPRLTIGISLVLPLLGLASASGLQEQFFPVADRDQFHFSVRLPTHASVGETKRVALRARDLLMRHPAVADVSLFVGGSAPKVHYSLVALEDNRPNFAQGLVQLRDSSVPVDLIVHLQQQLDREIPESRSVVTLIEQGPPAPAPIEFRIYGPSLTELALLGQRTRELLMKVPGVTHTRTSLDLGGPLFWLEVNQNEAEKAGLRDEVISHQIRNCLDGSVATTMSEEIEEIPIRVRLRDHDASDPERVLSLPLITKGPSSEAHVMPLGSVAKWSVRQQIFSIYRRNSSRCNIVYAYVGANELPIVVENRFRDLMRDVGFQVPPGYRSDFGGISFERNTAVDQLLLYSVIVVAMMGAVLVMTLGSFRMAGVIAVVGLLSVGLGLLSLRIFGYPIGIVSIIGIAGVMGLAVNDSIVVLNECQLGVAHGVPIHRSVFNATRHVMTTSLTTVAGVFPLILGGGDFWPPMMIVLAGGVVGATVIALGFTPACYAMIRHRAVR